MKAALTLAVCVVPLVASQAASPVDGRYAGQRTLTRGSAPICPKEGRAVWRIADGHFTYRFWTTALPLDIAPDGTFKGETQYSPGHGRAAWLRVQGSLTNGTLEADAEWRACQVHYSLTRLS
jgi:hypothetical protein